MPGSTSTAPNFRFRRCAKSSVYLGAATTHGAGGPKAFAPSAGNDGSVAFMSCSYNLVDCMGVQRSQRSYVGTGNASHKRRSRVSCESTGFGVVPYASTKRQRIRSIVIPCMRTSSINVLMSKELCIRALVQAHKHRQQRDGVVLHHFGSWEPVCVASVSGPTQSLWDDGKHESKRKLL